MKPTLTAYIVTLIFIIFFLSPASWSKAPPIASADLDSLIKTLPVKRYPTYFKQLENHPDNRPCPKSKTPPSTDEFQVFANTPAK
jgi:hypothetical protein